MSSNATVPLSGSYDSGVAQGCSRTTAFWRACGPGVGTRVFDDYTSARQDPSL
jgi:hypothetical protein